MWFSINIGWVQADDDAKVASALADIMGRIEALTKERGLYHPFVFANDASETQRPLQSYGTDVLDKLRKVRFEVDPEGFFQNNWPGGYKIGA